MSRRRKHHDEIPENLERWLLTYSDLITLLLAIFVLMYAFSKIKEGNPNVLSVPEENLPSVAPSETTYLTEAQKEAQERKFRKLRMTLEKRLKRKGFTPYVKVVNDARGLVIRMQSQTTFALGKADLTARARSVLDVVAPTIKAAVGNGVRVEGHTDSIPIQTVAFPSNWHLSTSRAISVIFYLVNRHHLPADRFQAQGYGDRRPLGPNDTDAHRAVNRRVDIVIVKRGTEFLQVEPRKGGAAGPALPGGKAVPPPAEDKAGAPAPAESAAPSAEKGGK